MSGGIKMLRYLLIACLLVATSCRPKQSRKEANSPSTSESTMSAAPSSPSNELPGPERAAGAAARTRARLERDLSAKGLHFGDPVFVRIFKEERMLEVWVEHRSTKKFHLFRTWPIAAMSGDLGPKLMEGDNQAPEGFYFVTPDRMKPDSRFHLAFNLGYPNAYDRAHGRTGTFLMVHGDVKSIGCFAMTDAKIEEIYTLCAAALDHGQPYFRVHCFPFRMTAERIAEAKGHQWEEFWENLKEGYDLFEQTNIPPDAAVKEMRYVFEPAK
jgi:murein L,D-transpeptidase YafK